MKQGKLRRVRNLKPKFGANPEYLIGELELDENVFPDMDATRLKVQVAFTDWGLVRGMKRAAKNPEDFRIVEAVEAEVKKREKWWRKLFG